MKKRALSLALACTMVVTALAGCSGGSKETTAATTEGSKAETKAAETTASAGGKTTLKWSVWDISSTTYYQPLIDAFEKAHPDVKIEMVDLGSTDYQEAVLILMW